MNYIVDIVGYMYDKLHMLVPKDPIKYNSFVDLIKIKEADNISYNSYNNERIRYTIDMLNSAPQIVHSILFESYPQVCDKFYQIYFKYNYKDKKYVLQYHNIISMSSKLDDPSVRYIYIRINLIKSVKSSHVNSVIIDKQSKVIIYFEPMLNIRLSLDDVTTLLKDNWSIIDNDFTQFKLLTAHDLGYTLSNKLQRFDSLCQTYVLYTFCLIVANPDISTDEYSAMFNDVIKRRDSIRGFLYNIYTSFSVTS